MRMVLQTVFGMSIWLNVGIYTLMLMPVPVLLPSGTLVVLLLMMLMMVMMIMFVVMLKINMKTMMMMMVMLMMRW